MVRVTIGGYDSESNPCVVTLFIPEPIAFPRYFSMSAHGRPFLRENFDNNHVTPDTELIAMMDDIEAQDAKKPA